MIRSHHSGWSGMCIEMYVRTHSFWRHFCLRRKNDDKRHRWDCLFPLPNPNTPLNLPNIPLNLPLSPKICHFITFFTKKLPRMKTMYYFCFVELVTQHHSQRTFRQTSQMTESQYRPISFCKSKTKVPSCIHLCHISA